MRKVICVIFIIFCCAVGFGGCDRFDKSLIKVRVVATFSDEKIIDQKVVGECVEAVESLVLSSYWNLDNNGIKNVVGAIQTAYGKSSNIDVLVDRTTNTILLSFDQNGTKTILKQVILPIS